MAERNNREGPTSPVLAIAVLLGAIILLFYFSIDNKSKDSKTQSETATTSKVAK